MPRRRGALAAAGFFLAVAAVATWPMVPRAGAALPDTGDPAESVWTLAWIAHALTHDPAHLYDAPIFHGFPNTLAYDDTSLLPGLLLAPLWLAPNHLLFYNLLMWTTLAALGWTAYLLIRTLTGSPVAGLVGGLVCAVNSYTLAHLSHLNVLSAYLLPLGLLALYHLFQPGPDGPRWRAAAGLTLALSGQVLNTFYIFAYLLIAALAYVGWQGLVRRAVWRWPAAWRRRLAIQLVVAGTILAATLAVVLAPYIATQELMGFSRSGEENRAWAARPLDYLSVSLHNRPYGGLLPHNDVEPLFAGFAGLTLGAAGLLVAARRLRRPAVATARAAPEGLSRSEAGFYGALLLLGVVLTLGPSLDLGAIHVPLPYALLAHLPGATALRAPVRAMALVTLAGGLFAGLGAAALLRLVGRLRVPALAPLLGGGLAVLILAEQWVAPLSMVALPAEEAAIPPVYRWLAAHPDGGVLVELPAGLGLRDAAVEGSRMYYQTWHGHPLVNGYSSFRPPTYVELLELLDARYSEFTPEQLGLLQSLDVRYLLYHEVHYKTSAWQRLRGDLRRFPEVQEVGAFPSGHFGADHLYTLAPRPPGAAIGVTFDRGDGTGSARVQLTNPYRYPLLARLRPTLDLTTADGTQIQVPAPLLLPPGTSTFPVALPGAGNPDTLAPLAPAPGTLVGWRHGGPR